MLIPVFAAAGADSAGALAEPDSRVPKQAGDSKTGEWENFEHTRQGYTHTLSILFGDKGAHNETLYVRIHFAVPVFLFPTCQACYGGSDKTTLGASTIPLERWSCQPNSADARSQLKTLWTSTER